MKLRCENVQGASVLTQFHGMSITSDKLRSMVKKWQSLIETNTEVRTLDGYQLRFFIIGFTRKAVPRTQKTAYAQSQQIRQIRKKMVDGLRHKFSECNIRDVVLELQKDTLCGDITRQCSSIYPLKDVMIYKVKVIKAPKIDAAKLLEAYTENAETSQQPAEAPAETAGKAATPVEAATA